jgi:hypothetical protein
MPFEIDAQHPDEFVVYLLDLSSGSVTAAAHRYRESLRNPAKTVDEYLKMLERERASPILFPSCGIILFPNREFVRTNPVAAACDWKTRKAERHAAPFLRFRFRPEG